MAIEVTDHPEHHRWEISVDGERAGLSQYRREGRSIAFTHTEIDDRFQGQGLAGKLIKGALDAAKAEGLAVVPYCPFVRKYVADHPDEYLALVPQAVRAELDL